MEITRDRYLFIDYLRGIAALMIVVFHSTDYAAFNHGLFDLFSDNRFFYYKCLHSVQVPLFMLVSGFTLPKLETDDKYCDGKLERDWIIRKFKQLVVPFVLWLIIPRIFNHDWNGFRNYLISVYKSPDNGYWFLWSLFLNHLLFWLSRRVLYLVKRKGRNYILTNSMPYDLSIFLLFSILPVVISVKLPLFIASIAFYYFFYIMGYYMRGCIIETKPRMKNVCRVCFVTWIVLCYYWGNIDFEAFCGLTITGAVEYAYRIILGGTGVLCVLAISYCLYDKLTSFVKMIGIIGEYTVEIYILQFFFYNMVKTKSLFIDIVINMICGLSISYCVAKSIHNGTIRKVLFGRQ